MKHIFALALTLFASQTMAMDAVEALKSHLPFMDYRGSDTFGEKCEIDLFGQTDGSLRLELFATSRNEFLVTQDMAFENSAARFVARRPVPSDVGTVEMSLIVEGERVSIQRDFRVGDRVWVSALTCLIED